MLNSDPPDTAPETAPETAPDTTTDTTTDAAVARIVAGGASGALVLAGIATAIVGLLWLAFYLLVFLPRASAP